jgi:membrane-associated phospholipid phosphatase
VKKPMNLDDRNTRKSKRNYLLFAIAVASLICFLGVLFLWRSFEPANYALNAWIPTLQDPTLNQVAEAVNVLDTTVLLVVSLPVAGFLFFKKEAKYSLMLLGAMSADALLLQVLKTVVASPRPLNALIAEGDYSFPSGHLTSILVLLGMLTYFAYQTRKPVFKVLAVATPVLGVLMALDRLYLNVHWLSDVLAAPFLAVFIIMATVLVVESLAGWQRAKRVAISEGAGEK